MGLFSMLFGAGVLFYAAKPAASARRTPAVVPADVHSAADRSGARVVDLGRRHPHVYALCGILVLWWFRRLQTGWLLAFVGVFLAAGAWLTVERGFEWQTMSEAQRATEAQGLMPTREQAQRQIEEMLGRPAENVSERASQGLAFSGLFLLASLFWTCAIMLLGMALFKWGFLDARWSARAYALTAVVGVPIGLGLAGYGALELERVQYAMPERLTIDLWNSVGALFASVGYAAAILWIVTRGLLTRARQRLAAVGQMALTNYLLQSVITSAVFRGWGFGFAGRFDYAEQLGIVAAIWVLHVVVSPLWLERYQFGPAEWLWRSLTYWKRQPMRRDASPTTM